MVRCPNCGAEAQPGDVFCHSCGQQLEPVAKATEVPPQAVKPVYPAAPAFEYAGFWRRFAAYLLDTIILALIGIPLTVAMWFFPAYSWYFFGVNLLSSFIGMVIGWMYFWFFESSLYQATPGKMALGIIVTDLNGSRISLGRAAARDLSKILSMLTLGIGFLMIGFTDEKRGLHDYIAGTLVVRK